MEQNHIQRKKVEKKDGMAKMVKGFGKKEEDLIDDIEDLNEAQLTQYLVELKYAKPMVKK